MRSPETSLHFQSQSSPHADLRSDSICNVLCNQHTCPEPETSFSSRKTRFLETEQDRNFTENGRSYGERGVGYQRRHNTSEHSFHDRHRNYGGIHHSERNHSFSERGYSDRERTVSARGRNFSERHRFGERDRVYPDRVNSFPRRNPDQQYSHRNNASGFTDRERDKYFENYERRNFSEETGRTRRYEYEEVSRINTYDPRRKRSFKDGDHSNGLKYRLKSRSHNRLVCILMLSIILYCLIIYWVSIFLIFFLLTFYHLSMQILCALFFGK